MSNSKLSYNDQYKKYVLEMIANVNEKLSRNLTEEEINAFYSAGSLMMLEAFDMGITSAIENNSLEKELNDIKSTGMARYNDMVQQFSTEIVPSLNRKLTKEEVVSLKNCKSIYEMWVYLESLST